MSEWSVPTMLVAQPQQYTISLPKSPRSGRTLACEGRFDETSEGGNVGRRQGMHHMSVKGDVPAGVTESAIMQD